MGDLVLILLGIAVASAIAYAVGYVLSDRWIDRVSDRTPRRADTRTVADIEADVLRLGPRFHALPPHASYAKVTAIRAGYDRALAEYCDATGTTHRLLELPEGPARDLERSRVEELLTVR